VSFKALNVECSSTLEFKKENGDFLRIHFNVKAAEPTGPVNLEFNLNQLAFHFNVGTQFKIIMGGSGSTY